MEKYPVSGRIIDSLIGKDSSAAHPLYKVKCPACGEMVQYRHFMPEEGLCATCYSEECDRSDQRAQELSETLVWMGN